MRVKKTYFVSGIDTDSGKSYVTGYLARQWREQGGSVITQKFIQTGCDTFSEDIAIHRRIMGTGLLPEDVDGTTAPIRLRYPSSPDLAARLEGVDIDLSLAEASTQRLLESYDTVLIEGAGGLMVPVRGLYTTLDYIEEQGLAVILVSNPRLGSLNHTLLSLEVCMRRGVRVDMLAYNAVPESSPEITADTRELLQEYLEEYIPECGFVDVPYINPG